MRRTILPDRIGWWMSQNIGDYMLKYLAAVAGAAVLATPTLAGIEAFPGNFNTQMVQINGTSLYVRVGGQGPAVILLHGFGDTGDMWAPLAAVLVKDHTVIVPDLEAWACRRIRIAATPRRIRR